MIIFLGLLVSAFLLAKKFGLLSLFTTIINPAKASFVRHDDSEGLAVFDITPARPSWTIIVICFILFLIGNWIYKTDMASGYSGSVPFFIWIFIPVFIFFLFIGARHRKPARLTVSDKALTHNKHSWPLAEITNLHVRKGSRKGEEQVGSIVTVEPLTGMVSGGKPTSALIGKALGGKMAQRSYLLTMRTRNSSHEDVLAGGLTLETAEALLQDLNECIRAYQ